MKGDIIVDDIEDIAVPTFASESWWRFKHVPHWFRA